MRKNTLSLSTYTAAFTDQGQGAPLIFLHGFLGSSDCWHRIIPELQIAYRCLALDLLGFGGSSKPRLRYNIWHQVEFLQQFIQTLDLQNFHLVGHSYGGWTAAAYSLASTGLGWTSQGWSSFTPISTSIPPPTSLNLIAPAGIRDDSFAGRYTYMKPLLWETPLVDWGLKLIAPMARVVNQQSAFQKVFQARQELLRQPVAKSFLVDRWRPEDAIDTVDQYLQQLQIPTQVIAGQQDTTIPLWHCQTYAEKIATSTINVIPNAAHDLIQTHSFEIVRIINRFLEQFQNRVAG
ncbi:alpha/beta fold hydrolase [Acaryochloris marina]|uniref:Hydrolase, alpha/beta fold family n=1 Tax=Acaryochloris marina (strain MBIC 11017) TaxID=329726 RepID=A8ZPB7_ACAM1|nr:alpha/beta hydrolase [Acaryochloris marina]ABW32853.1 hydrolase, alpha/beta fold family [Acaryochloris marina MBIC11017]